MGESRKNRLKLIKNTMIKMEEQIVKSMIKAFTMLESLLVLGLVSILALGLSGSVQSTFAAVEEQIFFMEFEELYRETQKRSVASQQKTSLNLDGQMISNGSQKLPVPKGIQAPSGQSIIFDRAGGNSSLAKVEFQTSKGAIRYQLYLGNGKIKRIKETKN
ncbi:type II secretion system protein [Streptococcus pneumoniae]|nr:type II secretion system protein [Streptococcus pneumoniae]